MATMDEIKEKFKEKLHLETLDTSASLKELGLDSLDIVELLLELEDEYSIHFNDTDMVEFKTIQDLLDAIEKQL